MLTTCAKMARHSFYHTLERSKLISWSCITSRKSIHSSRKVSIPRFVQSHSTPVGNNRDHVLATNVTDPNKFTSQNDKKTENSSVIRLQPGDIHVWWLQQTTRNLDISLDQTRSLDRLFHSVLTPEEIAECDTSKDESTRQLRLLARLFTRGVLSHYLDMSHPKSILFARNEHGKPDIVDPPTKIRFNVTHTPGLIGVAVSHGSLIGIDAEQLTRRPRSINPLTLAKRRFSHKEIEQLQRLEDEEERAKLFMKLWTLKEAYVKALGTGIAKVPGSLKGFSFEFSDCDPSGAHKYLRFENENSTSTSTTATVTGQDTNDDWNFVLMKPTACHIAALCIQPHHRHNHHGGDEFNTNTNISRPSPSSITHFMVSDVFSISTYNSTPGEVSLITSATTVNIPILALNS